MVGAVQRQPDKGKWECRKAPPVFCLPGAPESVSVLCFHRPNVILPQASLSGEDTCPTRAIHTCQELSSAPVYAPGDWNPLTPSLLESLITINRVHVVITALLSWHPWSRGTRPHQAILHPCSCVPAVQFSRVPLYKLFNLAWEALGTMHFTSRSSISQFHECTMCTTWEYQIAFRFVSDPLALYVLRRNQNLKEA